MRKEIPIVYEDDWLIVCDKPAGMPVQPDKSNDVDCETLLKYHIYEKESCKEEPYVAAVHRLDRPVGGLMVFAKDRDTAAKLSLLIKNGEFEKNYQAVVRGRLKEEYGTFVDYLLRDGKTNLTKIVEKGTKDAKRAELDYELIDEIETKDGVLSLVLVILHSGRHHQIRVQFAGRGLPLYGDTKYGKEKTEKNGKKFVPVGLYSTRISFVHPMTGKKMTFKTEPIGPAFTEMDVEAF